MNWRNWSAGTMVFSTRRPPCETRRPEPSAKDVGKNRAGGSLTGSLCSLNLSGLPTKRDLPGFASLAGLITTSDWIASSEEHFPYCQEPAGSTNGLATYDGVGTQSCGGARSTGLANATATAAATRFPAVLRHCAASPSTDRVYSTSAEPALPSLVIVEAPMGEGKTEAALFIAEQQKQQHMLRGSFIGLPTQATSNQMFGRVVKALSQGASDGIAHLLLLHGHASLSAEFDELKRMGKIGFVPSSVDEDGTSAQVMAGGSGSRTESAVF